MTTLTIAAALLLLNSMLFAQPDVPIEQWEGKTILLIGAHPDDDSYSIATLGMLNANGNEVYIAILTTGNVGTQDPDLGMMDLALIRKQEEQAALALSSDPLPWVSRAAFKLLHALDVFDLNPEGAQALDVGASTGGFTEVLLSRRAAHVHALDVGHGQLHSRLAADPRVTGV